MEIVGLERRTVLLAATGYLVGIFMTPDYLLRWQLRTTKITTL